MGKRKNPIRPLEKELSWWGRRDWAWIFLVTICFLFVLSIVGENVTLLGGCQESLVVMGKNTEQLTDCWERMQKYVVEEKITECIEYSSKEECNGEWKLSDAVCFELGEEYLFDLQFDYNKNVIKDMNISIGVKVMCPPICDGNLFYPCVCWSDEECSQTRQSSFEIQEKIADCISGCLNRESFDYCKEYCQGDGGI